MDSPAFRRWFGDSKVVDEHGQPLVVYHGTSADFDVFDASRFGEATDAGTLGAGFYFTSLREAAESYAVAASEKSGGTPRVVEAYLRIERPYVAPRRIWSFSHEPAAARKHSASLRRQKYDGIAFRVDLSALGEPVFMEYVVFDPRQIKSATDNIGTYDPGDRSILRNGANPLSALLEAGAPVAQAEVLRAWRRDDPSGLFDTIRVPGRSIRYIRWDDLIEALKDGDEEALDTMRAIMRAARGEGQVVEDEPDAPELDGVELEWGQRLGHLDPESKLILYHGTSSLFLPEILERGLVPSSAAGHTSNVGGSGFSEPSDAVFLSADYGPGPATAEFYARNAARRHGGAPIVLTVLIPVDRLEYDPDDEDLPSGQRQFIADYVHPSEIVED
jgi:hypothetical protein